MSKKVKAIFNTTKRNHRGFTIIEILTAIAILAVLSVTVFFVMGSSSRTYSKLSVEAQLQSEAQLVANMITELAIDSSNAYSKIEAGTVDPGNPNATSFGMGYIETDGNVLVLDSVLDSKKKQYVIAKKNGENKLYMAERTYDATNTTWGTLSEALLGEYINGFTVDTSRVAKENVLRFTLSYEKNGRTYEGNYQVLMRNRAYADREKQNEQPESGALLSVGLNPKLVYLNVKDDLVTEAYYDDLTATPYNNPADVKFSATVNTNSTTADTSTVDWSLEGHDADVFKITSSASAGLQGAVSWQGKVKQFKNSPTDTFVVQASKTITLDDGTTTLTRAKTARILLRRIKGLSLYALGGSTQWREEYNETGNPVPNANGYAYLGSNGRYLPMTIGASLLSSNIEDGGGLRWNVYQQNSSGGWDNIAGYGVNDNSALVTLQDKETLTTSSNVLNFGASVTNGQVYKVVAVSVFDPSWQAEYVFGIAPTAKREPDNDEFSIGFYQDLNRIFEDPERFPSVKAEQTDVALVSKLVYLKVTKVTSDGNSDMSGDKVKVIRDEKGKLRLYVDFSAISYDDPGQKYKLYTSGLHMHCVIGYYDAYGNLCIAGENSGNYVDELEAQEGRKVYNGKNPDDLNCYNSARVIFRTGSVMTMKGSPQKDVVVVPKGKARSISVVTQFYNILSPRNGTYYLGVYLDDFYNNLLEPGKASVNAYFNVNMISDYGDVKGEGKYRDNATIQLEAKPHTSQAKYLTEPMQMRITANEFYLLTPVPKEASYTTYKVLIANVVDTETYIAGPEATGDFAWSDTEKTSITNGTKTEIHGLDSGGNKVTAKVYKSGKKYYCDYAGRTYTYNATKNCWTN